MKRVKLSRWLASTVVCSLILVAGCTPAGEEVTISKEQTKEQTKEQMKEQMKEQVKEQMKEQIPETEATIALKFSPGDSTTYKLITETERRIKWEGPLPDDPTFKGGRNLKRTEMTFTQEIENVSDEGDAVAKITFDNLKLSSVSKSGAEFEFDSSKPKDPNHPLAKLIGHSYTIKISPTGKVVKIIDTKDAESAARKGSVIPVMALRLLKSAAIKQRHGILALPDTDKDHLKIGDSWSNIETFNFGMMGSESYEKIYTLNKIKGGNNQQVAFIKMNAIPASEAEGEAAADLLNNSDIVKKYTGELELDLTAGKINKYLEKLEQQWTVAFPAAEREEGEGPAVLTMTETRLYHIEEVD